MIGCDFKYNGHWLSDFNMIMCDPEDIQSFVNREVERGSQTSLRPVPNFYSVRYSDVLQLQFRIVKNDDIFHNQEDLILTSEELDEIRSWLESPKKPCELFVQDESNNRETYYFGLVTSTSPYLIDQVCYGLTIGFTCNAPYGFSSPITQAINLSSGVTSYDFHFVNASSEKSESLKPLIRINAKDKFTLNDTITISNNSDTGTNHSIQYSFGDIMTEKSQINIDCERQIITDENGQSIPLSALGVRFGTNYYSVVSVQNIPIYWPRLIWGDNLLSVLVNNNTSIKSVEVTARYVDKGGI